MSDIEAFLAARRAREREDEQRLNTQPALTAPDITPDDAATHRRLVDESGLSPAQALVVPSIARAAEANRLNALRTTSPRLHQWASQPENFAIARDDVQHLSWWERTFGRAEQQAPRPRGGFVNPVEAFGRAIVSAPGAAMRGGYAYGEHIARQGEYASQEIDLGSLGYRERGAKGDIQADYILGFAGSRADPADRAPLTEAERARLQTLQQQDRPFPEFYDIPGNLARFLPQMGHQFAFAGRRVASGRYSFGDPFAGDTYRGGASGSDDVIGRFVQGYNAAVYQQEAGQHYVQDRALGYDERASAVRAGQYAAVATPIEFLGDAVATITGGTGKAILSVAERMGMRVAERQALREGTGPILRTAVREVAAQSLTEGAEEGTQQWAQIIFQDLARQDTENRGAGADIEEALRASLTPESIDQILQAAMIGAQAGLSFGVVPGSINVTLELNAAKRAAAFATRAEEALQNAQSSKTQQRHGPTFEAAVNASTTDPATGQPGQVYIDADKWAEHFGSDAFKAAQEMGVSHEALAQALQSHGMISMPLGAFANRVLANHKHTALYEHTRADPAAQTVAEARADMAILEKQVSEYAQAVFGRATESDEVFRATVTHFRGEIERARKEGGMAPPMAEALFGGYLETFVQTVRDEQSAGVLTKEQADAQVETAKRFVNAIRIEGPDAGAAAGDGSVAFARSGPPKRNESFSPPDGVKLNARERQVAQMAINGAGNEYIAEKLGKNATAEDVAAMLEDIGAKLESKPWEPAIPNPAARELGTTPSGAVLPISPSQPIKNSLRGGSNDLAEAAQWGKKGSFDAFARLGGPERNESWTPPPGVKISELTRQIVEMAVNGADNYWIADQMEMWPAAVSAHLKRAKAELVAAGRAVPWEVGHKGSPGKTGSETTATIEEIMALRARGVSNGEIARLLSAQYGREITANTVKVRISKHNKRLAQEAAARAAQARPHDLTTEQGRQSWFEEEGNVISAPIVGQAPDARMYGFRITDKDTVVVTIAPEPGGATTVDWTFAARLKDVNKSPFGKGEEKLSRPESFRLMRQVLAVMEADVAQFKRDAYVFTPNDDTLAAIYKGLVKKSAANVLYSQLDDGAGATYLVRSGATVLRNATVKPSPENANAEPIKWETRTEDEVNAGQDDYLASLEGLKPLRAPSEAGGAVPGRRAEADGRIVEGSAGNNATGGTGGTRRGGTGGPTDAFHQGDPLENAREQGYEGQDIGEAVEWTRAIAKGLDMSLQARMERAKAMGFDTETKLYHATRNDFSTFDLSAPPRAGGKQFPNVIFLSDKAPLAETYHAPWFGVGGNPGGISAQLKAEIRQAIDLGLIVPRGELGAIMPSRRGLFPSYDRASNASTHWRPTDYEVRAALKMEMGADRYRQFEAFIADEGRVGAREAILENASGANTMPLFVRGRFRRFRDVGFTNYNRDGVSRISPGAAISMARRGGFDGVRFDDAIDFTHATWPGSDAAMVANNVAVFSPSNIRSIHAAFDPDFSDSANLMAHQGDPLSRDGAAAGLTRADFNAFSNGEFGDVLIRMGKAANMATMLHEFGHVGHLMLEAIAMSENAPQRYKDMWSETLSWWGITQEKWDSFKTATVDQAKPGEIDRLKAQYRRLYKADLAEHQVEAYYRTSLKTPYIERWAETFEDYLLLGKTPSLRLRSAFAMFKALLKRVYKLFGPAGANLTPQIRNVFDRLLATDKEIAEARAHQGADFVLPQLPNETPESYAERVQAHADAREVFESAIAKQAMAAVTRAGKREYRAQREANRNKAQRWVDSNPAQRALDWLGFREWRALPDTESPGEGEIGYTAPYDAMETMPEDLPTMALDGEVLADQWPDIALPFAVDPRAGVDQIMAEASRLKRSGKDKQAARMWSAVKAMGGIKIDTLPEADQARILEAMGGPRKRPGLINNKTGASPEQAMNRLAADGYFGEAPMRYFLNKEQAAQAAAEITDARAVREPRSLTSFVRSRGGILASDDRGDVKGSSGDNQRGFARLLRPDGVPLDDMALAAWEAGYFPDHAERPSIVDLIEALDAESRGGAFNADPTARANYDAAQMSLRLFQRLGIDTSMPSEDLAQFLWGAPNPVYEDRGDIAFHSDNNRRMLRIYHGGPEGLPNNRPSDNLHYFGTSEFFDMFPNDFGPKRYAYDVPPGVARLIVGFDSAEGRDVARDVVLKMWPDEEEFAQKLVSGDKTAEAEFYEQFSDRNPQWEEVLQERGLFGFRYGDEILLSKKAIDKLMFAEDRPGPTEAFHNAPAFGVGGWLHNTEQDTWRYHARADNGDVLVVTIDALSRRKTREISWDIDRYGDVAVARSALREVERALRNFLDQAPPGETYIFAPDKSQLEYIYDVFARRFRHWRFSISPQGKGAGFVIKSKLGLGDVVLNAFRRGPKEAYTAEQKRALRNLMTARDEWQAKQSAGWATNTRGVPYLFDGQPTMLRRGDSFNQSAEGLRALGVPDEALHPLAAAIARDDVVIASDSLAHSVEQMGSHRPDLLPPDLVPQVMALARRFHVIVDKDYADIATHLEQVDQQIKALLLRTPMEGASNLGLTEAFHNAPIWGSAVARTAETLRVGKGEPKLTDAMPGADWWNAISRAPGVKKQELEWLGLEDWLKARDEAAPHPADDMQPDASRMITAYHYTTQPIDGAFREGTYFSTNPRYAQLAMTDAPQEGAQIHRVELNIQNPYYVSEDEAARFINGSRVLMDEARRAGHDALIYRHPTNLGDEIVLLRQEGAKGDTRPPKPVPVTREEVVGFIRANGVLGAPMDAFAGGRGRRVINTATQSGEKTQVIVNPTESDLMRMTHAPVWDRARAWAYEDVRWIRDAEGNMFAAPGAVLTHDDIAREAQRAGYELTGYQYGDEYGHGAIQTGKWRRGDVAFAGADNGLRDVLARLDNLAPDIPRNDFPRGQVRVAYPKADGGTAVSAREATDDGEITTSWATLQYRAGRDMIVGEEQGDARPVRKDIFEQTYAEIAPGQFQKRSDVPVGFFVIDTPRMIETLEGPVAAAAGDYVLIGAVGEMWPVKPEKFAQRYDVPTPAPRADNGKAPDLAEFIDTLVADLRGDRQVYSVKDQGALKNAQDLTDARAWFDDNGIDLSASKEDIRAAVVAVLEARKDETAPAYHPDEIAQWFGFSSGDEMLKAIAALKPRAVAIEQRMDDITQEELGDPMNDGTMQKEAQEAAHEETQARKIEIELAALEVASGGRKSALARHAKIWAQEQIEAASVRDIRHYDLFLAGERRAAKQAFDAAAKGDMQAAALAKARQLMSFWLYHYARKADAHLTKMQDKWQRYSASTTTRAAIGSRHIEQIDAILDSIETGKPSFKPKRTLSQWAEDVQADGVLPEDIIFNPDVIAATVKQRLSDMSYGDVMAIDGVLKNIEKIGRGAINRRKAIDAANIADLREGLKERLRQEWSKALGKVRSLVAPNNIDTIKRDAASFHAVQLKADFIARHLDGFKDGGPFLELLGADVQRADNDRHARTQAATKQFMDIVRAHYTPKEFERLLSQRNFVPILKDSRTKAQLIGYALNRGTRYNFEALLVGEGWNEPVFWEVVASLDRNDWAFVQDLWKFVGQWKEERFALEERTRGVRPVEQLGEQFQLPNGAIIEGAYWPIAFDPTRSEKAMERQAKSEVIAEHGAHFRQPGTKRGSMIGRVGTGGQALSNDFMAILSSHAQQSINDLAYRETVITLRRTLADKELLGMIKAVVGERSLRALKEWLARLGQDMPPTAFGEAGALLPYLRRSNSNFVMGLKASVSILNLLGHFQAMPRNGLMAQLKQASITLGPGFADLLRRYAVAFVTRTPKETSARVAFVTERSPMVASFLQGAFDREIIDAKDDILGRQRGTIAPRKIAEMFQYFNIYTNQLVVIPAWMAAYDNAINGKVKGIEAGSETKAIDHADNVVRMTVAAGASKDLAAVTASRNEWVRITTQFMNWANIAYNQFFAEQIPGALSGKISFPKFAANMLWIWAAPAVLSMVLRGQLDREPDEDDGEYWTRIMLAIGTFPLATAWLVRDIASNLISGMPRRTPGDTVMQRAKSVMSAAERGDTDRMVKQAVLMGAQVSGIPQAAVTAGDYAVDLAQGKEDPAADPADAFSEALLRDTR